MVEATQTTERVKVNVVMEIRSACLPQVSQREEIKVIWSRSNKSVPTKTLAVDEHNPVAQFKDKITCDAGLRYNASQDVWLADPNELTMMCGANRVGVCKFDISQLIDVSPVLHKVILRPETDRHESSAREIIFKGDKESYGDAYIEFIVKVSSNQ